MDQLLPATPDTLDEALKTQALGHLRELLDLAKRREGGASGPGTLLGVGELRNSILLHTPTSFSSSSSSSPLQTPTHNLQTHTLVQTRSLVCPRQIH